jgi:hypothetical protein
LTTNAQWLLAVIRVPALADHGSPRAAEGPPIPRCGASGWSAAGIYGTRGD